MNPRDFLVLAKELGAASRACDQRSALSRAYYAAFHVAGQLQRSFGLRFDGSASDHELVKLRFEAVADPLAQFLKTELGILRRQRNSADYKLKAREVEDPAHVDLLVARAARVISILLILTESVATPFLPQARLTPADSRASSPDRQSR